MNLINAFDDVNVYSNIECQATLRKKELGENIYEYDFVFTWNEEQAKHTDSKINIIWNMTGKECQYMWHPDCRPRRVLDSTWRLKTTSMTTASAPLMCLFNGQDCNTYTIALDEIKKVTSVILGPNDELGGVSGIVSIGLKQFAQKNSHNIKVYFNKQNMPFHKALDRVRIWWEDVCQIQPMTVPEIAKLPMYSSWYGFRQSISGSVLEAERQRAVDLGMKSIIVDDGWQTEDTSSGYAFCGDWEVAPSKIPDMRSHVQRIHDVGLKYILWFSVPFETKKLHILSLISSTWISYNYNRYKRIF